MPAVVSSRTAKKPSVCGLTRANIQRQLEDIELVAVSAVRALQMDVDGDPGVPSPAVMRKARRAIR